MLIQIKIKKNSFEFNHFLGLTTALFKLKLGIKRMRNVTVRKPFHWQNKHRRAKVIILPDIKQ